MPSRRSRSLLLPLAALLALGAASACSRARAGEPAPRLVPPPATAQVPDRPRYPVPPGRMPVPDPTDGVYVLELVGGTPLPAAVGGPGACAPRVVLGTLSLAEDRFSYAETVQEGCEGQARTALRRAEGRFELDVATIRLTADAGGAFSAATGVFVDRNNTVQIVDVTGAEGSRRVDWRFRRQQRVTPRP